jgi:hypothetical protein
LEVVEVEGVVVDCVVVVDVVDGLGLWWSAGACASAPNGERSKAAVVDKMAFAAKTRVQRIIYGCLLAGCLEHPLKPEAHPASGDTYETGGMNVSLKMSDQRLA